VPYQVIMTSKKEMQTKPEVVKAEIRVMARTLQYAAQNPEGVRAIREYLPSVPAEAFNQAVETYRKGLPATPVITKAQCDKTVTWMNIGVNNPPKAPTYEDVVIVEPTASVTADVLKK